MGHIAAWAYLGIAWVFILLVLLKRWRERERCDAAETARVLKKLLHDNSHKYEQDAL